MEYGDVARGRVSDRAQHVLEARVVAQRLEAEILDGVVEPEGADLNVATDRSVRSTEE